METLLTTIIKQAAAKGISQKALAASAGMPQETLSRMKRKPSVRAQALERLAKGAGLRLMLVDAGPASVGLAGAPPTTGKADTAGALITPPAFQTKIPPAGLV